MSVRAMKIKSVNFATAYYQEAHPLHELAISINELNTNDFDEVMRFFGDMVLPEGYYAAISQQLLVPGYWIDFYENYDASSFYPPLVDKDPTDLYNDQDYA
jgi:hypothetical protein